MKNAMHLLKHGYSYIPSEYYKSLVENDDGLSEKFNINLQDLKAGFTNLNLDPYSPGNRYRSYVQCIVNKAGEWIFGHFDSYLQTKKFNPDTGGVIRTYPTITENILFNPLFKMLLKDDIAFVTEYGKIGPTSETLIWIHLFRYKATIDAPAFSSPMWLHKDDEDVVFVHFIDSTKNMVGGDSLIATNNKNIERVIRLENVFDTLVVNHDKFHAVTPVGCSSRTSEGFSTRDVILVTFQKRRDMT
jgi:hypothetical protein